ncbi:MAG TPA: glycerophosphodiester phosphodiesterase family protein [Candidatus Marinimicrobia bacterium]|nr:glycerophosphodiester phosphodiesterase family protein [Candidatus Neomarinimicrobiota bacterium]
MKRKRLIVTALALIVLILCACGQKNNPNYRAYSSASDLKSAMSWHNGVEPMISAHRGGPMSGFPENAIETFENSLTYAPCIIECDIRVTRDGHLVLMHDATIDRTTNGKGTVSSLTLDQLKLYRLVDENGRQTDFQIPTLKETLIWAKGKTILMLDIKQDVEASHVVNMVREMQAEAFSIIITYNWGQVEEIHALAPDLMISASVNSYETAQMIFSSGTPMENFLFFVGIYEPELSIYNLAHLRGIRTILGTMHNLDNKAAVKGISVYQQLYQNGADILSTDNVPLVAEAIKAMK